MLPLYFTHLTGAFGLNVPEPVMREAYIMQPDVSPVVGWETGRASEPAFMDMNLHAVRSSTGVAHGMEYVHVARMACTRARGHGLRPPRVYGHAHAPALGTCMHTWTWQVRGDSTPSVCLYQFDLSDAMNPLGLLMAYAETFQSGSVTKKHVKPVISDFDTFTVGSKGMKYESVPEWQLDIVRWSLDQTALLLQTPNDKGWMQRWLDILKQAARDGFHPPLPTFGFGDPTSSMLISDVVDCTASCGAVRHGAECYNFYFPQDLDDE